MDLMNYLKNISLQWVCYVVELANAQCFSSHFVGLIKFGFVQSIKFSWKHFPPLNHRNILVNKPVRKTQGQKQFGVSVWFPPQFSLLVTRGLKTLALKFGFTQATVVPSLHITCASHFNVEHCATQWLMAKRQWCLR